MTPGIGAALPMWIAAALAFLAVAGCATTADTPPLALTPPAVLCADAWLTADDFCLPAEWLDDMQVLEQYEIVAVEVAPSGFSRPKKLQLRIVDDRRAEAVVIAIKWKPAPRGGQGFNNHPRKELAAYELQKLFLEPDEYVIPPTAAFCIPVARHRAEIGNEPETFPGSGCVFGLLAYWVENATTKDARDLARFERDPAYRANLAKLNLLTHLIDQRDSRDANFLVSTDPDRPRLFAIDNGLAFGGFKNPFAILGFIADWSEIQVPELPRSPVERLRALARSDLDPLAVVAQFERRDGTLVRVPAGAPESPEKGVSVGGSTVQLGLTQQEIDRVHERLQLLLERVDRGELGLF